MANYTQQQLDDLRAAMATGALVVETPSMKTTFRNLEEMIQLENRMMAALTGTTSSSGRTSYATYSKD